VHLSGAFALVYRVWFAGSRILEKSGTYSPPHCTSPVAMPLLSPRWVELRPGFGEG